MVSSEGRDRGRFDWTRQDTFLIWALIVFAAILRFPGLSTPSTIVFDEAYYARDSCLYTGISQSDCDAPQPTEQSYVHPPLGKWLIAIGIKLFGYKAFGWRAMAAVAGTVIVPLVYLLTRKLFKNIWMAGVAGLLSALDYLLIVQSRVAMLDIFMTLFVVLGFYFLAFDREQMKNIRENAILPFPGDPPKRQPEWRFAAGAAFGLAMAVKWAAGFALAGALAMTLFWSADVIRAEFRDRDWRSLMRAFSARSGQAIVSMVMLPVVVYVLSYSLWIRDNYRPEHCTNGPDRFCASGVVGTAIAFEQLQVRMWDYHRDLRATHTYQAQAWTWPLVARPIAYYYVGPPDSPKVHHILVFANPVAWWAALVAPLWLIAAGYRKWRAERFVVATLGWQYIPWLLTSIISAISTLPKDPVRPLFFFYMTPIVPFMMIGLAHALASIRSLGRGPRWLVRAYLLIGIVGLFVYFLPIIYGTGISQPGWNGRMWFRAGCSDKPANWCWI